jgi:hypothetical protein
MNHLIKSSPKVTKKLKIGFDLDAHGLVVLILSSAYHEIKYFFEVNCNGTPFVLVGRTIPCMF